MKELTGLVFGMLEVLRKSEQRTSSKGLKWVCKCQCGRQTTVSSSSLIQGATRSCGCLVAKATKEANTTHGMSNSEEYSIWIGMKTRCLNQNEHAYKDYGARGITVSEEWMDFKAFYADMGQRPSDKHTIERINNDLGYCKANCRWATRAEQARNYRRNKIISYNGAQYILSDLAKEVGIKMKVLSARLLKGWDVETAVSKPLRRWTHV